MHTCARNKVELYACLLDWKAKDLCVSGSVCDVSSCRQRENLMKTVNTLFYGKLYILVRLFLHLSCLISLFLKNDKHLTTRCQNICNHPSVPPDKALVKANFIIGWRSLYEFSIVGFTCFIYSSRSFSGMKG